MNENLQKELDVFNPYVALVEGLTHKYDIVHDTSTVDGLAVVKAGIKDVGKVVRDIEAARKDKKSFYLESGRAVDAKAKEVTVPFSELLDPMKEAKKEHDDSIAKAKQKRLDELQGKVDAIRNSIEFAQGKTSAEISKIIEEVDAIDPEDGFYQLQHDAIMVRNSTLNQLATMLTEKLNFEESEKVRIELEAKQKIAEEEKAKNDKIIADFQAKEAEELRLKNIEIEKAKEAERVAEITKQAEIQAKLEAEQAIKDAQEAKERAEREKEEAAKQAIIDKENAVKAAQEQARLDTEKAEARRLAEEEKNVRLAKKKAENKAHMRSINKEALACLVENGFKKEDATNIITLIAQGKIKNITVNY